MKKLCFVLLALVLSQAVCAQDSLRYSTFSIGVGAFRMVNKDRFQSPDAYRGINIPTAISFSRVTPKHEYIASLSYTAGAIRSSLSPRANNQLLVLDYDYLLKIRTGMKDKLSFSAGPGLHTFLNRTNYLPHAEQPPSYLTGGTYLALTGMAAYKINSRSRLTLRMSVPVAGVVFRPDAVTGDKTRPHAGGYRYSAELRYTYKISDRVSVFASYQFNYFGFNKPQPVNMMWTGVSAGTSRRF